jgi:lysyl-tRNA synthetase class 2
VSKTQFHTAAKKQASAENYRLVGKRIVMSATDESAPEDYLPTASLEILRQRAQLLDEIRRYFHEQDYWEVETPILSHDILVDAFLEPFATRWIPSGTVVSDDSDATEMFLQTSPEFGMKRLLAAGADTIFQITRAFRNGEVGRYHNPEFTILEWYHTGRTHLEQMQFTEELVKAVFSRAAKLRPDKNPPPIDLSQPFGSLTYDEAFEKYVGSKVLHLDSGELDDLAEARGIISPPGLDPDDRDGLLNLLLAELIEPHLGKKQPQFLLDYPASQAALARIRPGDPPVAERFELYIEGIEICNGYHELTDPEALRTRMQTQAAIRDQDGLRRLPNHNRLLEAMQAGLPCCAGVALGVDRLLMSALGAESIAEITAFPFDRA